MSAPQKSLFGDGKIKVPKLEDFVEQVRKNLEIMGRPLESIGPNPCNVFSPMVFMSHSDKPLNATSCIPYMPDELVGQIASSLSIHDINNLRLVSKRFKDAVKFQYGKKIMVTEDVTIFPTFSSIASFFIGLSLDGAYAASVRTITLVGEAGKAPEIDYDMSWFQWISRHDIKKFDESKHSGSPDDLYTLKMENERYDDRICDYVNEKHAEWDYVNFPFVHTGQYRDMLSILLSKLPNLRTIETRKLHVGEHIRGWVGPKYLENLTYYTPDLPINEIYYGEWQYDSLHKFVTTFTDEFGEEDECEGAGPQVGFKEDVIAAMEMSGTSARLVAPEEKPTNMV